VNGGAPPRLPDCPGTPNCVCSQDGRPRHAIEPLRYEGPAAPAWAALRALVAELPRTRIVEERPGRLHAEVRTRLFRFVDDLHLQLDEPAGVIHVRSASRLGRSDFGVNRRRVEALRAAFSRR
jgi:uncharacterized protein (DUF1499 family)